MKETIAETRKDSPFSMHLDPAVVPLGSTPVRIQFPNDWNAKLLADDVDAKRRELPMDGTPLVGVQQVYEGFILLGEAIEGKEQAKSPYYCYLAVNDTTAGRIKDAAIALRSRLRKQFSADKTTTLDPFAIGTPTGQSLQWSKASSTGPQPFYYVDAAGKGQYRDETGLIELYCYTKDKYQIVICWRLPENLRSKINIDRWSKLMAGSVVFPE